MTPGVLRKRISLALFVVLMAVLGWVGWSRWGQLGAPEAALEGRYRTEEQWIAAEIVQDIAEMALFGSEPARPAQGLDFSIEGLQKGDPSPIARVSFALGSKGRVSQKLEWREHLWSPQDYQELSRLVLTTLGRQTVAAPPSTDETTLTALLTPRATVVETQNQRVSQRLSSSIFDADAHEDAALVVGSLALREASGYFWDVRQLLCRMTAHLALAQALRGAPVRSVSGRYADAILSILSGRTAEAMAQMDRLDESAAGSQAQAAWLRFLRLRVTYDWRTLPEPGQRTLLEQLGYFLAVSATLGGAAAVDFYEGLKAEPAPDWGRVAFWGDFGTSAGAFASDGVDAEVAEARDLWTRIYGRPLPPSDFVTVLNRPAERCVTADGPRALAWGTWAASLQRHICHRLLETDTYLRRVLGLPDEAQGKIADFDRQWGDLVLYPFVQGQRWQHGQIELESFGGGLKTGVRTAALRPELINASLWDSMRTATQYAVTRRRMPDPRPWFAVPVPAGSAYDVARRMKVLGGESSGDGSLAVLRERNPWSNNLSRLTVKERFGERASPEAIREVFGPRADYDLSILGWRAEAAGARSPERERLLMDRCQLLADECITLARHLVALNRDDDGASALRRAFDSAQDRVYVANNSFFLVRHYHEHGQAQEATRVAEDAAGTGAGEGLETMGLLLEWRGRLPEAEQYFTQIETRYDDTAPLLGFCRRRMELGQPGYDAKFQRLIRKRFPAGVEHLEPTRLTSPPRDGVRLSNAGVDAELCGLESGDLVVGLDGWRVHSEPEYLAVRAFDWRPDLRLHIWRKGRYADVQLHVMNRYLPLDLETYPVRRP